LFNQKHVCSAVAVLWCVYFVPQETDVEIGKVPFLTTVSVCWGGIPEAGIFSPFTVYHGLRVLLLPAFFTGRAVWVLEVWVFYKAAGFIYR
jgi:hypothetical protein